MPSPLRLACTLLAVVVSASSLTAQAPVGRAVSFSGGASAFDASGTGTAPVFAVRADQPIVGRWLLAEVGVVYARLEEQFRTTQTNLGIVEAQLQAQLPLAHFRPFLGLGLGTAGYLNNAGSRDRWNSTASIAAGARIPLTESMGLRGELRVRGWNFHGIESGFTSGAAETTFGLSLAF